MYTYVHLGWDMLPCKTWASLASMPSRERGMGICPKKGAHEVSLSAPCGCFCQARRKEGVQSGCEMRKMLSERKKDRLICWGVHGC